ncbi:hypothetical protein LEMLEM_LOCUS19653 [Lemmus lemmus]
MTGSSPGRYRIWACCCCPCCGLDGDIFYDDPVITNSPNETVKTETQGRFCPFESIKSNNYYLIIKGARREDTGSSSTFAAGRDTLTQTRT